MLNKVRKTIEKYGLLEKGDKVTVGFSGGADSTALISVLYALRDVFDLTVSAVHVNHGIRGEEAKRDEDFVIDFCKKKNIPLTVFHKDIPTEAKRCGESEEECGRRIRYECFAEVSCGGKIATAHTLSDSIETMVFNMLRGSSVSGLCSIPVKRDNIIRPLIECSREEIEKYCEENGLSFVTDSTNLNSDYTRNYIRRELLPMFERINPSYTEALSRLKNFACEDSAYLEKEAANLLSSSKSQGGLSAKFLSESDSALIKRAIHQYIKNETGFSAENRHIELIYENLLSDFTVQLNSDYFVCVRRGVLSVRKKQTYEGKKPGCIPLKEGENEFSGVLITAMRISREDFLNNYYNLLENAVDCDKIKGNIFIRTRQEGDRIFLHKRKVSKTLKKLFCEMKLPKEKRDSIPVISDSEKVLWVEGVGVNGVCRATDESENIMIIKSKG